MNNLPPLDIEILLCGHHRVQEWNHKEASAPYWYFYWNDGAGAYLSAQGKDTPLDRTSFILIPANFRFSTYSTAPFPHLYIHFTAGRPYDSVLPRIYSFPLGDIVGRKAQALSGLMESAGDDPRRVHLLAYSLIYDALLALGDDDFKQRGRFDRRVESALRVLDGDTSRLIDNEELAGEARMTPSAFIRLFTRQVGVSPQKYSRKKRVDKASLMLHFSDKGIEEIARETGFIDRYHFTKVFTKLMGLPPSEFRKQRNRLK